MEKIIIIKQRRRTWKKNAAHVAANPNATAIVPTANAKRMAVANALKNALVMKKVVSAK